MRDKGLEEMTARVSTEGKLTAAIAIVKTIIEVAVRLSQQSGDDNSSLMTPAAIILLGLGNIVAGSMFAHAIMAIADSYDFIAENDSE